jgi:hypothetical protein
LNFTNWTTLSHSQPIGPYIYSFGGPTGVVTDSAGKIYVLSGTNVIRVDDMTGANWTSISVGTFAPHTIAVDSSGMVLLGNGYDAQIVDSESAVFTSNISGLVNGVYVSVYGAVPVPLPSPLPSAISLTPPNLTFSQNVGTTSAAQTITITNFGGTPLDLFSLSASGVFSETNNCPSLLTPGTNCAVQITFTPSAAGPATGTFNVSDDSGNLGATQVLALNGTGTTPATTVSPASLSFSSQALGNTSTPKTITVQSTGTGPLQVTSIIVAALFSETDNCIGIVAPGASCTIQVTFSPTILGSASGTVVITDNAGTQTVAVTGSGSSPVTLSPTSLSFGNMAVGDTSAVKNLSVTNRLNVALSFTGITATGPFAVASNTCGGSIAAGANCTIGVTFTPTALGNATGVLTIADSALNSPQTVNLTGTGSLPVTFSTNSLSFSVVVGGTSSPRTVTVTNQQNVPLNFTGITTNAPFAVASNTCGASLAAGASCTVGVTFTAAALGTVTDTLTFADDATNSPQTVSLSGTGVAPVTLSTSSLNFNSTVVGNTSSARSVTLTNQQSIALNFSGVAATAPFAIATNTCGASLAAGAHCAVGVTFSPTALGSATGTLTFTDDAGNSPQTVSLSGNGSAPVTFSSSSLNFGTVTVGTTSSPKTVTVTNRLSVALSFSSITADAPFAVVSNTCGGSIAAGANCTVGVTFSPTATGSVTGSLTFTDSALTSPQTVNLSGGQSGGQ